MSSAYPEVNSTRRPGRAAQASRRQFAAVQAARHHDVGEEQIDPCAARRVASALPGRPRPRSPRSRASRSTSRPGRAPTGRPRPPGSWRDRRPTARPRCPVRARPWRIALASGNRMVTVVPRPGALSSSACPPDCLAKPNTMLSPRPVPLPTSLVVKNGSNAFANTSGGMPMPVSDTRNLTKAARRQHRVRRRSRHRPRRHRSPR